MPLNWLWVAFRPDYEVQRHEIRVSNIVALDFHRKSMLMIQQDPGDEVIAPLLE